MSCQNTKTIFIYTLSDGSKIRRFYDDQKIQYTSKKQYTIGCGHCEECVRKLKKEYVSGLMQEYLTQQKGMFITLTYKDNSIINVSKRDIQLFMKRLRKAYANIKLKYFAVSEYGPRTNRPHYHIILYGLNKEDLKDCYKLPNQANLYSSKELEKIRNNGIVGIGDLNEATIKYVAGYVIKKLDHKSYKNIGLTDTFILRSKKIGKKYFEKNKEKILKNGGIYINGHLYPITKYEQRYILGKNKPILDYSIEELKTLPYIKDLYKTYINNKKISKALYETNQQKEIKKIYTSKRSI